MVKTNHETFHHYTLLMDCQFHAPTALSPRTSPRYPRAGLEVSEDIKTSRLCRESKNDSSVIQLVA
jgi:hypothetical protein